MSNTILYENLSNKKIFIESRINPHAKNLLIKFHMTEIVYSATSFLATNASLRERLLAIKHNVTEIPKCKNLTCTNTVHFNNQNGTYHDFCSRLCISLNDETKIDRTQKSKDAIKAKYGVTNVFSLDIVKEKIKNTKITKYGTENHMMCDAIIQKRNTTNLQKYGYTSPLLNSSVNQKTITTNIEKYGTHHHSSSEQGKEKLKNTLLQKYQRYSINQLHISQDVLEILNNKEKLQSMHYDEQKTLTEIANDLNVDVTTISNYFNKHKIEIKRLQGSYGQKQIVEFIKSHSNTKIIENDNTLISPHELDIYLPEFKLAIEYCGLYWHCEIIKPDKNYHLNKLVKVQHTGNRLITIFEDEWEQKQDIVKTKILHLLKQNQTISIGARKCKIVTNIPTSEKDNFFTATHIQGTGPGSITIGLLHNDELVACCCLIDTKTNLILNRFSTKYRIPGGFSKIIQFIKSHFNKQIVTFADRRWSNGKLYDADFRLIDTLPPDYKYFINATKERKHKFGYRHKSLCNKLKRYDPNLTEHQNCLNNGIYRIYDCGLLKYISV